MNQNYGGSSMLLRIGLILGLVAVLVVWLHSSYYKPGIKREILKILDRSRYQWWLIRDIANAPDHQLSYEDIGLHIGELVLEGLVARKPVRPGEPIHMGAAQFQITQAGIRKLQKDDNDDSLRPHYT